MLGHRTNVYQFSLNINRHYLLMDLNNCKLTFELLRLHGYWPTMYTSSE